MTRLEIVELLQRSQLAVERAILRIHSFQTADEQQSGVTKHLNGMGWNGYDAEFGTSLARWIENGIGRYRKPLGQTLTTRQLPMARKLAIKYSKQLEKVENGSSQMTV